MSQNVYPHMGFSFKFWLKKKKFYYLPRFIVPTCRQTNGAPNHTFVISWLWFDFKMFTPKEWGLRKAVTQLKKRKTNNDY